MADIFYVTNKSGQLVAAKFLQYNGQYVKDPNSAVAISAQIYDSSKNAIVNANPNGYLIVPAEYSISETIEFANNVSKLLLDSTNSFALLNAAGAMVRAYVPNGTHDLQRHYAGSSGVNPDDFVAAFTSAASFDLGLVAQYSGFGFDAAIKGGGMLNYIQSLWNAKINTTGKDSNNPRNVQSIEAGGEFAKSIPGSATADPTPLDPAVQAALGSKIAVIYDDAVPAYVKKLLPGEGNSLTLRRSDTGAIIVIGHDYVYNITQYYKGLGYDVTAYAPNTSGLSALIGVNSVNPLLQSKISYNQDFIPVSSTNFTGLNSDRWVSSYDSLGRKTEMRMYGANSTIAESRTIFNVESNKIDRVDYFDASGNIIKQDHFDSTTDSLVKRGFDASGREIQRDTFDANSGNLAMREYFDVLTGNVIQIDYFDVMSGKLLFTDEIAQKPGEVNNRSYFSADGLLQERDFYVKDDKSAAENIREIYNYQDGTITRENFSPTIEGEKTIYTLEGGKKGQLIYSESHDSTGTPYTIGKYDRANGALIYSLITEFQYGVGNTNIVETWYGDNQRQTERRTSSAKTNLPISDLHFDPINGNLVSQDTFDNNGTLTSTDFFNPQTGDNTTRVEYYPGTTKIHLQLDFPPGAKFAGTHTYFKPDGSIDSRTIFNPQTGVKIPNQGFAPGNVISQPPLRPPITSVPPPPKKPSFSTYPPPPKHDYTVINQSGQIAPGVYPLLPYNPLRKNEPQTSHLTGGITGGVWSSVTVGNESMVTWQHWSGSGLDILDGVAVLPVGVRPSTINTTPPSASLNASSRMLTDGASSEISTTHSLVQAMAAFSPSTSASLTAPIDANKNLASIISSNTK
ncbi:hypothetical protein [Burkholderia gladioli]|uniref:hypothetical protein n=1 Tax=Burkholderia gladioli TaxID=28095 RepID=UPI00163FB359|nr:hypothetical protein [Burkholderia gladioli]